MKKAVNLGARKAWLWRHRDGFGAIPARALPRLLVDVSAIIRHDAQTGIQRVVRAVWSELLRRNGNGFEVVPVFATTAHGYCYAPIGFLQDGHSSPTPVPVRTAPGDKFLGLDLSAHLLPKYRQQLRSWRNHGATIHIVVYDLLPINRPQWFTPSAVSNFRKWLGVVATEADQAICISDHVAGELRDLIARGAPHRLKFGRVRMGADIAASVPTGGVNDRLTRLIEQLRFRPGILMVGTIEPRKGYEVALAAFDHIWRSRPTDAPDLVIVGKAGWKTTKLQDQIRAHPAFGSRLHWFNEMSDEGLCMLYDACSGLFVASRGEGWGLPLIEATMHRRFVLARDLPVFREHRQSNISYFADDSPKELGERLIELANVGRSPCPEAQLPNWSDTVDDLLAAIGLVEVRETAAERELRIAS